MKADVSDVREHEALRWAVDYFRGRRNFLEDFAVGMPKRERALKLGFIYTYDDWLRHDEAKLARWVSHTTGEEDTRALRQAVADLLERGDRLPKPLADFAAAHLRDHKKAAKVGRGRKANHYKALDMAIAIAMRHITKMWGFKPTRSVATRDKNTRTCAASIVKEALKTGAGIGVGESRIASAWRDNHSSVERVETIEHLIWERKNTPL
jgi:hypothetical protein